MTKYQYVYVAEADFAYLFLPPEEDERKCFTGPNRLQDLLTWAGARGWRLAASNHDLSELVFERPAELVVSIRAVKVEFETRSGADASRREVERGPRAPELG